MKNYFHVSLPSVNTRPTWILIDVPYDTNRQQRVKGLKQSEIKIYMENICGDCYLRLFARYRRLIPRILQTGGATVAITMIKHFLYLRMYAQIGCESLASLLVAAIIKRHV